MLVGLLLLGAVGWLVSRARRVQRAPRERRPVLTDEHVTAAELRARAERALAEERYADALVDAFRAVAVRQVERHRIDDLPGRDRARGGRRAGGGVPRAGAPTCTAARASSTWCCTAAGRRRRDQAVDVLGLDDRLGVRT